MDNQDNTPKSGRGGYRPGAGNTYKWKHGETKAVRIPIAIADQILKAAEAIDQGQQLIFNDCVTQSEKIELTKLDELDRENLELHEKVGNLTLALQLKNEELAKMKDCVTQSNESELPNAGELLSVLRQRFPKSKTSLADIDHLLDLIEEMTEH